MVLNLPKNWEYFLKGRDIEKSLLSIKSLLEKEKKLGKEIFPRTDNIFRALELVSPEDVKVVVVGQDPYHNINQANGLAFSVNKNNKIPPSLKNIYREIERDLNSKTLQNGDLTQIAKQGVLFLNSVLTVEAHKPGSHLNIGWQEITDTIISLLSSEKNIVFMLWGNFAQLKEKFIDLNSNLVLKTSHPSPLSAYRGFIGSRPFSKSNKFLKSKGKKIIDWSL